MEINVYIQNEAVVPRIAELIGWPPAELYRRLRRAEQDGVLCVITTKVTAAQWQKIKSSQPDRRRTHRRQEDRERRGSFNS